MHPEHSKQEPFTVVTANTQYGRAIATPEHTADFAGSDILLLQEVLQMPKVEVESNLGSIGLKLAALDEEAGLAIAVSDRFTVVSSESHRVQARSRLADTVEAMGIKPRFRKRSLLVAELADRDGTPVIAATGHPIVYVRFLQRLKQVKNMSRILADKYPVGNLIFGADKNHYPGPRKVDRKLAQASRLKPVNNMEPTVILTETKHKYLRSLGFKDGQLDILLSRGFQELRSSVLKIKSDHRAIKAVFSSQRPE